MIWFRTSDISSKSLASARFSQFMAEFFDECISADFSVLVLQVRSVYFRYQTELTFCYRHSESSLYSCHTKSHLLFVQRWMSKRGLFFRSFDYAQTLREMLCYNLKVLEYEQNLVNSQLTHKAQKCLI